MPIEIIIRSGVAILYPWCNHGIVQVTRFDNEGKPVSPSPLFQSLVLNEADVAHELPLARQRAAQEAGVDGYAEIAVPPCKRCRSTQDEKKQKERRVSHGVRVTPHL